MCDADRRIISFNARYSGSTYDAFIWPNSAIRASFHQAAYKDALLLGNNFFVPL